MKSLSIIGIILLLMIFGKWYSNKQSADANSQGGAPSKAMSGPESTKPGGPKPGGGPNSGPPSEVDVVVATLKDISDKLYTTGTLIPNEMVDLRAEASGIIQTLKISEGGLVSKGQLIAKIKDDDIRAQLKKLEVEAKLAEQIEARQKKLLDINAISKEEYDIALSKINTLQADKESLLVRLRQTEVRAPFSGRIGLKNISVGAYVTPSISIATLVQTQPIKVEFDIPEKYNRRVQLGKSVSMETDDDTNSKIARIIAIDPNVDVSLRTIKMRASYPNPNMLLKPGMFVKVEVPLSINKSFMLPTEALVPFAGGKKVFKIINGKAFETPVVSGLRTDKELEILDGISTGDTIVVSGLMNIKDGQALTIKSIK